MKIWRSTFKIIAWALAFFLATAGIAQAVNICKGECCLSLYPAMEFDSLLAFCDPIQEYSNIANPDPEQQTCRDGEMPSCCRLAQANHKVQGLTSRSLFRADPLLDVSLVCLIPQFNLTNDQLHVATARYSLPARTDPVPLYIKNTSFLC